MPALNKKVSFTQKAIRIAARIDRIDFCLDRADKGASTAKSKALVANLKEEREARLAELTVMKFKSKGERAAANG
jgi:hypothetical protein